MVLWVGIEEEGVASESRVEMGEVMVVWVGGGERCGEAWLCVRRPGVQRAERNRRRRCERCTTDQWPKLCMSL
jgi:hypothetical protein